MSAESHLLRAFDRAVAAAHRAARARAAAGDGPMGERFAALRDELARARVAAAEQGSVDPAWVRDLVRSTAAWLPDDALPLLAALGAIARAGTGGR